MIRRNVYIYESDMTRKMLNFRGTWRTFLGIRESDMTRIWSWQTFGGICDSNMTQQCRVSVVHDEHILGISLSDMTRIWSWQTYLRVCESDMTRIWSWQTFLGVCESDLTRIWSWQTFCESEKQHLYVQFQTNIFVQSEISRFEFFHVKRRKQKFLYELKLINTFAVTYSGDLFSRCDGQTRNLWLQHDPKV